MSVKMTGDLGKLGGISSAIRGVPKVVTDIAKNASEECLDLVLDGFANERDPYGQPWAPLKSRKGIILTKTGRLRRSFTRLVNVAVGGVAAFQVGTATVYAAPHQDGSVYGPRTSVHAKNKRGRFISKKKAASSKSKFVHVIFANRIGHVMDARPMVPDDRGLPESWAKALDSVSMEVLADYFERKG